ncbi:MAG: hypothetical protein FWB96_12575 [Defluviitaleaceae bacterium]|nr:hypothetical protein [Defluviitaleaceae bacterium]MCL2263960.1 hypothetical protein [Defluviitaleaceae bacterium]
MKAGIRYHDSDKIEKFLSNITADTEKARDKFLRKAGRETKKAIMRHMPQDTSNPRRHDGRTRLVDDVSSRLVEDKSYGHKQVRVSGTRTTGTLWHLVDGGGYKNRRATNFMTKAMSEAESKFDSILDIALKEEFG